MQKTMSVVCRGEIIFNYAAGGKLHEATISYINWRR